jgi:hypothetical protein
VTYTIDGFVGSSATPENEYVSGGVTLDQIGAAPPGLVTL